MVARKELQNIEEFSHECHSIGHLNTIYKGVYYILIDIPDCGAYLIDVLLPTDSLLKITKIKKQLSEECFVFCFTAQLISYHRAKRQKSNLL